MWIEIVWYMDGKCLAYWIEWGSIIDKNVGNMDRKCGKLGYSECVILIEMI